MGVAFWCAAGAPERRSLYDYVTVDLPEDGQGRVEEAYGALAGKIVGLVGAGSLGSMVAAALARAGVGKFLLIDDDVLLPGNLVRHDLDWRAVGAHKVEGVVDRLKRINPAIEVDARRVNLGGQELAESTGAALNCLGMCDLVIDATAEPGAFNLCATVCRTMKKPLVWGEVFAGGIGGMVARARPDLDPPPHSARMQIAAWCQENGPPPGMAKANGYCGETADWQPMVADDADVGAIAAHLARFAIDTLLRTTESSFPHSVYMVGLKAGWKFDEPFHTFPIAYVAEGEWGVATRENAERAKEAFAFIGELIPELKSTADVHSPTS